MIKDLNEEIERNKRLVKYISEILEVFENITKTEMNIEEICSLSVEQFLFTIIGSVLANLLSRLEISEEEKKKAIQLFTIILKGPPYTGLNSIDVVFHNQELQ